MPQDFQIDSQLARLLLQAQGDPITDLKNLPDSAFATTCREAGERVVAAAADIGYRHQHARFTAEDDGHEPATRLPVARIAGFQCAWIDPRLLSTLAHDFNLDADRHARLIGSLLVQFFAYVVSHPITGDFGVIRGHASSGDLSVDVASQGPGAAALSVSP